MRIFSTSYGPLIALNILIVLKLKKEGWFGTIGRWQDFLSIGLDIFIKRWNAPRDEYCESPLRAADWLKIENLYSGIFSSNNILDEKGEYSFNEMVYLASSQWFGIEKNSSPVYYEGV